MSINKKLSNGKSGLINLGNTCFLNTAIQCLSNIKELREYFLSESWKQDINRNKKETLLAIQFSKLLTGLWEDDCVIKPISFIKIFGSLSAKNGGMSDFSFGNQHDSYECLLYILDMIHTSIQEEVDVEFCGSPKNDLDELMIESIKSWKSYIEKDYSIIVELFGGQYIYRMYSDDSSDKGKLLSHNFQKYNYLMLPIPPHGSTIYDCLDSFTDFCVLDGDNKYNDEENNRRIDAKRKCSLWKLPKYLVIAFKRFDHTNRKINKLISYPIEGLDLEPYTEGYDKYESKYDLICIGNHAGGTRGGHYYSYCKSVDGKWYSFNDDSVSEIRNRNLSSKLITPTAYYLVYKKRE